MTTFLIVGLLGFLVVGVPIGFSMLLTSIVYLLIKGDVPMIAVAQRLVAGTDQYLLLAIPFFFLAAELMNSGGIMNQLVRVAMALVGHFRGGLGHVSVLANILLSGISGSAAADAAGLGRLQVEMMKKGGYGAAFAAALGAAAATIGPVIPPSIPFVVYGGIAGVSVGALFLAGIIPGLLMGVFLMVAVWIIAKKRDYPLQPWAGYRVLARETVNAIPILVLPLIILGGILSGAFTATEAAVVAAAYAFVVGKFLLRTLELARSLSDLRQGRIRQRQPDVHHRGERDLHVDSGAREYSAGDRDIDPRFFARALGRLVAHQYHSAHPRDCA